MTYGVDDGTQIRRQQVLGSDLALAERSEPVRMLRRHVLANANVRRLYVIALGGNGGDLLTIHDIRVRVVCCAARNAKPTCIGFADLLHAKCTLCAKLYTTYISLRRPIHPHASEYRTRPEWESHVMYCLC